MIPAWFIPLFLMLGLGGYLWMIGKSSRDYDMGGVLIVLWLAGSGLIWAAYFLLFWLVKRVSG